MKKLLALLAFVCLPAFSGDRICATIATNTLDCSYYSVLDNGGASEVTVLYADLVPNGETRPIVIMNGFVHAFGVTGSSQKVLLVESPAGSGKWKFPLAWQDDTLGRMSVHHITPGVTLTSDDELCLQNYGNTYGASWGIHYRIGP